MSVGSELDVDMQDVVQVFKRRAGQELLTVEPDSYEWSDSADDVLADLLKLGWLPPTYTAAVGRELKTAFWANEDDDAFQALQRAAGVLDIDLASAGTGAGADAVLALTSPAMLAALGKVR